MKTRKGWPLAGLLAIVILGTPACGQEDPRFLSAKPVWLPGHETEMNLTVGFRACFDWPDGSAVEKRATLKIAAATIYRASINGKFLARGPARGPHGYYRVDQLDITRLLRPGRNLVAIEVAGYNVNFYENFLLPKRFAHLPEGMLPMCYPADHYDGVFIPNWALWFVVQLEEYLERSGNRQLVDALQPKVMRLLEYFRPFENSDGLLEKLESWVFVEWSAANKFVQDVNYPSNLLYMADRTGTLWENDGAYASCDHGFASHIVHTLYRDVLGLAGVDRVDRVVRLRFGDAALDWCEGSVPTPEGVVRLRWTVAGDQITYQLDLPEGYQVEVENQSGKKLLRE